MDIKDIRLNKMARQMFSRHGLDIAMADVRVSYGTCFVRGRVCKMPKSGIVSTAQETIKVTEILRKMDGIKAIVLDCTYDEDYFKKE